MLVSGVGKALQLYIRVSTLFQIMAHLGCSILQSRVWGHSGDCSEDAGWGHVIWGLTGAGGATSKMAPSHGCCFSSSPHRHLQELPGCLHLVTSFPQDARSKKEQGGRPSTTWSPEVTHHHSHHTVLFRRESLSPAHTQGREIKLPPLRKEYHENVCARLLWWHSG